MTLLDFRCCTSDLNPPRFNGQRQRWECSLRSRGEFNVANLATQFGGGGHPNAAGFTLEAAQSPCRGVLDVPLPAQQAECSQASVLEQRVALTVEYQHRFDPYRGARKRAYLIAAERCGVSAERARQMHADRQAWLENLSDADLRERLEALLPESL